MDSKGGGGGGMSGGINHLRDEFKKRQSIRAIGEKQGERGGTAGGSGEAERTQAVFIRHGDEVCAMAWNERLRTRVKTFFTGGGKDITTTASVSAAAADAGSGALGGGSSSRPLGGGGSSRPLDGGGSSTGGDLEAAAASISAVAAPVQYRLEATSRRPRLTWSRRLWTCFGLFSCCGGGDGYYSKSTSRGMSSGINPNQKLALWLHWMFRVNFVFLFAVMCIMFFTLVIIFAGFITLAGVIDPQCVRIGGNPFNEENTAFADAFALSWTTFSTVGYGSTYPALGYQNESVTNCFFINFICSLESLIGVLYSGFCGAILFGKVLRIQSHAQVIFSDPVVIRYGPGLKESNDNRRGGGHASGSGDEDDNSQDDTEAADKMPCPVLEFRIVNRLYGEAGGEIMDASLNVVANVDANDADPSKGDNSSRSQSKRITDADGISHSSGNHSASVNGTSEVTSSWRTDASGGETLRTLQRILNPLNKMHQSVTHHTVEEDPSSRLLSKHIFSKMMIEASDHPFFKRVWLARHVLDETSPILKPNVRKEIQKNGGFWPAKRANHAAIRRSLKFNQILVSLNGVSNVSASDVYAQKIYDFVDINIGYQFVNILYRDPTDGSLGVDIDLINDVREQNGGGGEPLIIDD